MSARPNLAPENITAPTPQSGIGNFDAYAELQASLFATHGKTAIYAPADSTILAGATYNINISSYLELVLYVQVHYASSGVAGNRELQLYGFTKPNGGGQQCQYADTEESFSINANLTFTFAIYGAGRINHGNFERAMLPSLFYIPAGGSLQITCLNGDAGDQISKVFMQTRQFPPI